MMALLDEKLFRSAVLESAVPVMVVFTTRWSGAFHIVRPMLESTALEYQGVLKSYLVDVENARKLAEEFAVSQTPTTILFSHGQVVEHIVGPVPAGVLKKKIDEVVQQKE